jgi:serine protease Do
MNETRARHSASTPALEGAGERRSPTRVRVSDPVDTSRVKRWRRSLAAALALAAAGLLLAPPASAQGAPDEAQADEEGERTPPPPPRSGKKKGAAPAPARGKAADESDRDARAGADRSRRDAADKDKKEPAAPAVEERAARGVVVIERGGQVLGLGAVLAGDGRVLTALSPLGPGNDLEARFADGSVVRVKLGHHDRVWDLALLVPQTGKWPEGLTASSREPVRQDAQLRSFSSARGKPAPVSIVLRSHRALIGGDDRQLEDAIELGSRVSPLDLGAPIVDEDGRVVAVVGRGCTPNEGKPCTPVAFGVPVAPIKTFLRTVPPSAVQPSAWLGIQGVSESGAVAKGVRVTVVHPESPADEARLKGGDRNTSDMVLAVDGVPVTTPEALADAIRTHAVGEKVPLTLFSRGKYRQATVLLRAAPDPKAARSPTPPHQVELPPPEEYRK